MPPSPRPRTALAVAALLLTPLALASEPAAAATAKSGAKCTKAGAKSGPLVCVRKSGKLVWASAPTTTKATTASAAPATTAPATAAPATGIEGAWKATSTSIVGYRVKEVLFGQTTEGVGRTKALTGTLTVAGTVVTAVELTADLTTLESDEARRDSQVQDRILNTAKFPKATLKLLAPIELGKVPADKEEVKATAKVALTLHGVTKEVELDVTGRRNGANLEVVGSTTIVFADYSIPNPSNAVASVGESGALEFAVVFAR